jgi:hypothetical protein
MIATAARNRIYVANVTDDLRARGVEFAITEAPTAAEQRRLSRKRRRGARREVMEDWRRPSNKIYAKGPEVTCSHLCASQNHRALQP